MPVIFYILWLCAIGAIAIRSIDKYSEEDFEAGSAYVAIIILIIVCTFGNKA